MERVYPTARARADKSSTDPEDVSFVGVEIRERAEGPAEEGATVGKGLAARGLQEFHDESPESCNG